MKEEDRRLFLHCGVDCEPLSDRSPACGGPSSWEVSEKAIRRFVEIFTERGMLEGLAFNPTPEAGRAHSELFRELRRQGLEIGIQPNVPGFRFPKYKYDLGYYDLQTQRRIIGEALEDFESALGFRPLTYLPCCGSRNEHTNKLLIEYGFKVLRHATSGRYFSNRPDRCTIGMFPFPHWASEHHIVAGFLRLYVVPTTGDITSVGRDKAVPDLRPERPPTRETLRSYRYIINTHIEVMNLIKAPVKAIVIGTHNTEYVHFENLLYVLDYIEEKAKLEGMELVPASTLKMREVAESL